LEEFSQSSPPGRGRGWVKTGTDYNRVLLQQDELGEVDERSEEIPLCGAKSAPAK